MEAKRILELCLSVVDAVAGIALVSARGATDTVQSHQTVLGRVHSRQNGRLAAAARVGLRHQARLNAS